MTLHDYTNAPEPMFRGIELIKHPIDILKVIGFVCRDLRRGETVAVFKRNRREDEDGQKHYVEKYGGYAISATSLVDLYERGINTVYVLERNGDERLIEFDIQQFANDATTIVYDTVDNTLSPIAADRAKEQDSLDVQKVVAVSNAKRVWPGEGVDIE